jgi:hypothetical protein
MEDIRFDDLTLVVSQGATRRRLVGLVTGLIMGSFRPYAATPIPAKKGKKRRQKKLTICHNGQTIRVRKSARKVHKKHGDTVGACSSQNPLPLVSPTCNALGQSCTAPRGTPCCPDVDPNVECAGWFHQTCQDCGRPPMPAGVLCQNPPGNQCCGGSQGCYVGARVQDGSLVCVTTGLCLSDPGCTHDFIAAGCPAGERCCPDERPVCIENDPDSPCCPTTRGPSLCNPLCPTS